MVAIEEHISIVFFKYFCLHKENVINCKLLIMQVCWHFLCITSIRIYDHNLIVVTRDPNVLHHDHQCPCHCHSCNY